MAGAIFIIHGLRAEQAQHSHIGNTSRQQIYYRATGGQRYWQAPLIWSDSEQELFWSLAKHPPPPPPPTTHPQQLFLAVSQLPVVGSEHVRTLFDSTQSQESKSEVAVRNRTRQCALGPILRHTLYLWCLGSNLDVWDHFSHLQNLRNPNLTWILRGNAH